MTIKIEKVKELSVIELQPLIKDSQKVLNEAINDQNVLIFLS